MIGKINLAALLVLASCSGPTGQSQQSGPVSSANGDAGPHSLFLEASAVAVQGGPGYSVCQGAGQPQPYQQCGKGCPAGDRFISWNPNTQASCQSDMQPGCEKIANLHYELGWNGGNKSKFCRKRNFDGMTNHPNSRYKGAGSHGGGWCYKGEERACTASLPEKGPD